MTKSSVVVKKTLMGYSAEGAALKVFLHNNKIKKVYVKFFGETGNAVEEYYFKDGKLIFNFRVVTRLNKPGGKVASKTTTRYYFKDGKLIRWLNGGKPISFNKEKFKAKANSINMDVKEYIIAAKMQGDKIDRQDILKQIN